MAKSGARDWMLVSEMFKTLQGEGPTTGVPAFFVRLGACNQHCRWCDTDYTWAFSETKAAQHQHGKVYDPNVELKRYDNIVIAQAIHQAKTPLAVITGGEPLLQLFALDKLISLTNEYPVPIQFEIETAGTIYPAGLETYPNVSLNVSPKLESSGNELDVRYHPEILQKMVFTFPDQRSRFKFVITEETQHDDIAEVENIVEECNIPKSRIWLMPEGVTAEAVIAGMKRLEPIVIRRGWNLTGRAQTLMHGDERGH